MSFGRYGTKPPHIRFELWNLGIKNLETKICKHLARFSDAPGAASYPGHHDDEFGIVPSTDDQLKGRSEAIEVLKRWLDGKQDGLAELNGCPNDHGVTGRGVDHDVGKTRCLTRQSRAEGWYAKCNRRERKVWGECCPACCRALRISIHQKGRG